MREGKASKGEGGNLAIILQSRTGSVRLPNKAVLPFWSSKGLLETLLLRLKKRLGDYSLCVATTTNEDDNIISEVAKKNNVLCYRGSENNVLDRFIKAAESLNVLKVIRICADNPFIDIVQLEYMIEHFLHNDVDYWTYIKADGTPVIKTHYGFWGEGVSLDCLKRVKLLTSDPKYLEHVTNYIYEHKELFNIHEVEISQDIEKNDYFRFTIDTNEDFINLKQIFSKMGPDFDLDKLMSFVLTKKDSLAVMKQQILQNSK